MKKIVLIALLALFITAFMSADVFADGVAVDTSLTIIEGGFSAQIDGDVTFTSVTLNGYDQTTPSSAPVTITIIDARQALTGWHVTLSATNLTGTPSGTLDVGRISYISAPGGIARDADSSGLADLPTVTTHAAPGTPLTIAGIKIVSATQSSTPIGKGAFVYTIPAANLKIFVPAETRAGTYTGEINATIADLP